VTKRARVLVVQKQTPYREYTRLRDANVLRLLAARDPAVRNLKRADAEHRATLAELDRALRATGALVTRTADPRKARGLRFDLVITLGGDGTLLRTSHHVGPGVPVLGVNSAPAYSVGFFCGARKGDVARSVEDALAGTLRGTTLARMMVVRNGEVLERRVLNEVLFCHANPAATSRYLLRLEDGRTVEEDQRSSGVWVGPAAGSTAAQRSAGGRVLPLRSRRLQFVVREPYRPSGAPLLLPKGLVPAEGALVIRNKMQNAQIFVDGHQRAHACALGDVLEMRISSEPLVVLGVHR
jgi:NAD+ kinase